LKAKKPRSTAICDLWLRLVRSHSRFARRTSQRRDVVGSGLGLSPFSVLDHGIGGLGTGATPQMADAHGGSGGVGIREPFPCLDGEQFGSVAGLHVMHMPVNVLMSG